MASLLLDELSLLVTPLDRDRDCKERKLLELRNAAILIEDGVIKEIGATEELRKKAPADIHRLSGHGRMATPGLVDCHTHPVFIGNRADEFFLRNQGKSYQEIAAAGGGIQASARRIAGCNVDHIVRDSLPRFQKSLEGGVTTIECKTGYGLEWDGEQKLLIALREIQKLVPMHISKTFLVHAVPDAWKDRRDAYLDQVCNQMIPDVAARRLANCVDVFCETGAFNVEESRRVLTTAQEYGLDITIHANQFGNSGGALLAAELKARSSDHLEHLNDDEIRALRDANVMTVALPACVFFMGTIPYPPMRKMIDQGLRVALATDMNPGTAMTESLPFCMTAAAIYGKMTPQELLWA
ncbi:imidazolonepropionase, partial [bacterium]|nr:imidazolonepropionase [bacterium]